MLVKTRKFIKNPLLSRRQVCGWKLGRGLCGGGGGGGGSGNGGSGNGGCGLLITGNVMVKGDHLERPGNVIIAGEQSAEAKKRLKAWSAAASENDTMVWMQISHSGRQCQARVNKHPKSQEITSAIEISNCLNTLNIGKGIKQIKPLIETYISGRRS